MTSNKLKIYTDGGARGNPGPAGIGAVVYNEKGELILEVSEFIGNTTNNQAEYKAVVSVLEKITEFNPEEINFFLDSELVVKQLNGDYKVKNPALKPLFLKIKELTKDIKKLSFSHIRREFNKQADHLANLAMDKGK